MEPHELGRADAAPLRPDIAELYPPELDNVLSNLSCFSGLQLLSFDFPFDHCNPNRRRRRRLHNQHEPCASTTQKREDTWRGLVSASFGAIASNYTDNNSNTAQFASLEIHNLNPIALPVIATTPFHSLLSRLKSLKLTLAPPDYLSLHDIITVRSASIPLDNFGPWLFNHLASLEELSFNPDPSNSGPHMGNAGQNPAYIQDIGPRNATMPKLKKVTLANIFVCAVLTGFLCRHLPSLEDITLHFCRAYVPYDNNDGGNNGNKNSWSTLFKSITSANPPALKLFTFTTPQDELILWSPDDDWLDSDLVEAMYRKRDAEPNTLLFPHYEIWDRECVMRDMGVNIRSFLDGEDYGAFLGLRGVLRWNAGGEETRVT